MIFVKWQWVELIEFAQLVNQSVSKDNLPLRQSELADLVCTYIYTHIYMTSYIQRKDTHTCAVEFEIIALYRRKFRN